MEDFDHHQSGALIGSNEDLLTEILIRLPITSILRFKSVCKHWRLLLTNSHLTHRYDNNNFSESLGYYFHMVLPIPGFANDIYVQFDVGKRSTCSFLSFGSYINCYYDCYHNCYINPFKDRIVQSCNGLLLYSSPSPHDGVFKYSVFNPTTKQLANIPSVPKTVRFMALAYHQTHCVHYKVVCICALEPGENIYQIQIYSSETRKWNTCIESFSAPKPVFYNPVYWNGAVYWPPYDPNRNYFYLKIDVGELQRLPLPKGWVSYDKLMYFGESRGHLHLILHKEHRANILILNVYEMLMDHSGWFVKYKVQLYELLTVLPNIVHQHGYNFNVVDVVRGKEEKNASLVLSTRTKMIRYNVHDKSFKELYSKMLCFALPTSFHRHIEALSSF